MHSKSPSVMAFCLICLGILAKNMPKQMAQLLTYLKTVEGTHVTVADVCSYFKEQGITIGTTTVYRNLEKMVEQGLVAKYNVDGTSSACFEYLGAEEHCHKTVCFHCKCEKCGKLIHLHCEDVVKLRQHLMEDHGFQMDSCRTVFLESVRTAEIRNRMMIPGI